MLIYDFTSAIIYIPLAIFLSMLSGLFNGYIFKLGISRFYTWGIIICFGMMVGYSLPLNFSDKYQLYSLNYASGLSNLIIAIDDNFTILLHNINFTNSFMAIIITPILWLSMYEIFFIQYRKNIYLESIRIEKNDLININKYICYVFWIMFVLSAYMTSIWFAILILISITLSNIIKKLKYEKFTYIPLLILCFVFLLLSLEHVFNIRNIDVGNSIKYINFIHKTYGYFTFYFNPNVAYATLICLFFVSLMGLIAELNIAKNISAIREQSTMTKIAQTSITNGIYIGDTDRGKKIILPLNELNQHMYVNATTGGGKTTLFLRMIGESVKFKMPIIFVDGKGSPELVEKLSTIAKNNNVAFKCFSFIDADYRATYDFLQTGNRDELRNKLMNLLTSKENEYYFEKLTAFVSIFFAVLERYVNEGYANNKIDLHTIYKLLNNNDGMAYILDKVGTPEEKNYFANVSTMQEKPHERIMNVLTPIVTSAYGTYLDVNNSNCIINLVESIKNNEIVLFLLDVSSYQLDTEKFGKLIIDDINASFSYLARSKQTKPTLVIFDEFGSYASASVVTSLATHRSNGLHGVIGSQSLETIANKNDLGKSIVSSINANTNTRVILRSLNQYDLESFANTVGTEKSYEMTHQVETTAGIGGGTGLGSMRIGNKYRVDIQNLRGLSAGVGYIYRVALNTVEKIKVKYDVS